MSGPGTDVPVNAPPVEIPSNATVCWNCMYGAKLEVTLRCVRFPPVGHALVMIEGPDLKAALLSNRSQVPRQVVKMITVWPAMYPTDMCGEFNPANPELFAMNKMN